MSAFDKSTEAQFLTAKVLNSHGLNSAGRVVTMDAESINDQGLHSLILVSLSIPIFGVQLKRLFPVGRNVSLSGFLAEQWSNQHGIFALPKVLQVAQNLAPCDAGLFDWIEGIGGNVVVVSEDAERSISPSEPTENQLHAEFTYGNEDLNRVEIDIERVNASLEHFSKASVDLFYDGHNASEIQAFQTFQMRERSFLEPSLIAASSDANFEYLFSCTESKSSGEWRTGGLDFPDKPAPCIDELAAHIACWPAANAAMLKWSRIKLQALDAFLARKSSLDGRALYRLYEYLCVDASGDHLDFIGGNIYAANGRANIDVVVHSLTHGSDRSAFFEISNAEVFSARWRVALVWGWRGLPSAILFDRGSKEAELLDAVKKREAPEAVVGDMRWALENIVLLQGFSRFGRLLRGKHGKFLT